MLRRDFERRHSRASSGRDHVVDVLRGRAEILNEVARPEKSVGSEKCRKRDLAGGAVNRKDTNVPAAKDERGIDRPKAKGRARSLALEQVRRQCPMAVHHLREKLTR